MPSFPLSCDRVAGTFSGLDGRRIRGDVEVLGAEGLGSKQRTSFALVAGVRQPGERGRGEGEVEVNRPVVAFAGIRITGIR